MRKPKILRAFSKDEFKKAHILLASKVAIMMGRKFEEGDWAEVYCQAKNIPNTGWSNLDIDIMHGSLGVEHKMLCRKSRKPIKEYCGTTLMHPSATRSIRIPSTDGDPTEVARDVLRQYAEFIEQRRQKVAENSQGSSPDMRTGWLLWQESLREFLYFEEEMFEPNPEDYWAEWRESGGGTRKKSKNLWIYDSETNQKRYSITTGAGPKIQPYFDVPAPNNRNLFYFLVQGEPFEKGLIRVWITPNTALILEKLLGKLDTETVSSKIVEIAEEILADEDNTDKTKMADTFDLAQPILLTVDAYKALTESFTGVSDEHMMQLFVRHIIQK